MTILYNVQNSHSDMTIEEISSSTVGLRHRAKMYTMPQFRFQGRTREKCATLRSSVMPLSPHHF